MSRRALLLIATLVAASFAGGRMSTALLTETESVAGAHSTDVWRYFLHNRPTPPSGDTTAQVDLSMSASAPTGTTLYNYATDLDVAASGRVLRPSSLGAGETGTDRHVNWRSDVLDHARLIDGTVRVELWSALRGFAGGRGVLGVYLRDFDPGAGTSTAIASVTLDEASWSGGSADFVEKPIDIPVSAYEIPSGHRLELKLVSGSGSADDLWIGYDTAARDASVRLP